VCASEQYFELSNEVSDRKGVPTTTSGQPEVQMARFKQLMKI
jgi:hypothetical protein